MTGGADIVSRGVVKKAVQKLQQELPMRKSCLRPAFARSLCSVIYAIASTVLSIAMSSVIGFVVFAIVAAVLFPLILLGRSESSEFGRVVPGVLGLVVLLFGAYSLFTAIGRANYVSNVVLFRCFSVRSLSMMKRACEFSNVVTSTIVLFAIAWGGVVFFGGESDPMIALLLACTFTAIGVAVPIIFLTQSHLQDSRNSLATYIFVRLAVQAAPAI